MSRSHVHRYRARCRWQGSTGAGYESYSRAHDGDTPPATTRVELSADPAFRGEASRINPEQLLVLAAASCQLLSFLAVAARARVDVRGYDDRAEGFMPEDVSPVRVTRVRLRPTITVGPGTSHERLTHLVEVAHRQCYIANTLGCEITVEPTITVQDYAFADTEPAAARLRLLAEVFNPTSRAFLTRHAPPRVGLAVDLGCGPGAATAMLAEATGASRTLGLDSSTAFLAAARTAHTGTGVEFLAHDLTRLPFPEPALGAEVGFARFLLAHLPDRAAVLTVWLTQLHPLGVLLVEETEAIHTDDPVLTTYLGLAEQLLAARGATLYSGAELAEVAAAAPGRVLESRTAQLDVAAARAAELFTRNLAVWRTDPAVTEPVEALDRLAEGLERLRQTGADQPVRAAVAPVRVTSRVTAERSQLAAYDLEAYAGTT